MRNGKYDTKQARGKDNYRCHRETGTLMVRHQIDQRRELAHLEQQYFRGYYQFSGGVRR